jgi:hypothetical protein
MKLFILRVVLGTERHLLNFPGIYIYGDFFRNSSPSKNKKCCSSIHKD